MILTLFIPSYNCSTRLEQNISYVFEEIEKLNLTLKVAVLVGDNASTDNTPLVCERALNLSKKIGIEFDYFRNEANLGLSGNVESGYFASNSKWMMLLSDDDQLLPGALAKICLQVEEANPSLAIFNFNQSPYSFSNPLTQETKLILAPYNYSELATLVLWFKLTGIVIKIEREERFCEELRLALSLSKHFPHVILSLFLFKFGDSMLRSQTFVGQPDADFLDHVNFVPYITEYLVLEMEKFRDVFDPSSNHLQALISGIPRNNIIDSSTLSLIGFYRGETRLSSLIRRRLWSNVFRFISRRRTTVDNLFFGKISVRTYLNIFLLAPIFLLHPLLLRIARREKLLMPEGF
jgi:glycosyltransferase involved in cell wall biosynthesis